MGGSKKRRDDKKNVILLCHTHHDQVTTGGWKDGLREESGVRYYWRDAGNGKIEWIVDYGEPSSGTVEHNRIDDQRGASSMALDRPARESTQGTEVMPSAGDTRSPTPKIDQQGEATASVGEGAGLTWDAWVQQGEALAQAVQRLPWAIGDWVIAGETLFNEKASQHYDSLGLSQERLANYAWVARQFPPSTRVEVLSWTHHREVAALPEPKRAALLTDAQETGKTTRELRDIVKGPPEPRAKRYSVAELREIAGQAHWGELPQVVSFLDWLQEREAS
jgi:hypothetical protein